MADTEPTTDDPAFLMEAARVFNAAGSDYWGAAAALAESAWQKSQKDAPADEIFDAIVGDAAALRLADRLPGGYRQALAILKTRIGTPGSISAAETKKLDDADKASSGDADQKAAADARLRLYLLRALALGQQYKDQKNKGKSKDDPEMVELRANVLADLRFVFDRREAWAPLNESFWKPPRNVPAKDREDDLAEVYADDADFQKYVDDKVSGSSADNKKGTTGSTPAADAAPAPDIAGAPTPARPPSTS